MRCNGDDIGQEDVFSEVTVVEKDVAQLIHFFVDFLPGLLNCNQCQFEQHIPKRSSTENF